MAEPFQRTMPIATGDWATDYRLLIQHDYLAFYCSNGYWLCLMFDNEYPLERPDGEEWGCAWVLRWLSPYGNDIVWNGKSYEWEDIEGVEEFHDESGAHVLYQKAMAWKQSL